MRISDWSSDVCSSDLLLMDGEIAITQNDNPDKPFIYRGFRMVDENKLRELSAEKLEELNKNGILVLINAQLFVLNLKRVVFLRKVQPGTGPEGDSTLCQRCHGLGSRQRGLEQGPALTDPIMIC